MRPFALWFNLLAILAIAFWGNEANSQWIRMSGPYGWDFDLFTANNSTVLGSGLTQGIFRSTDNGLTWSKADSGMWDVQITSLGVYDQIFFAGASDGTNNLVFRSSDNGTTWEQVNTISPSEAITCFATTDTIIYAGTFGDGAYLSTDGGFHWRKPANSGLQHSIVEMVTAGSDLFAGTYGGGVYESTDNGESWTELPIPNYNSHVGSLFFHNGKLCMVAGNNLYNSTDFGSSWNLVNSDLPMTFNGGVISGGSALYLGCYYGVYTSTDEGSTWHNIGLSDAIIEAIEAYNGNLIAGTGDIGVFTSQDNGASWLQSGGANNMMVQALAVIDSNLIVGDGSQEGVFVSRDRGNTYTEYHNLLHSYVLRLRRNGADIYACTEPADTSGGGLFKSSDYGKTWQRLGLKNIGVESVVFDSSYLFAGSPLGIFRTSNGGETWSKVGSSLLPFSGSSFVECDSDLYAAADMGVFRSVDHGTSWSSFGLKDTVVVCLGRYGTALLAGTTFGLYKCVPPDSSWRLIGLPDTGIGFIEVKDSLVFVSTPNDVFLSKDNCASWSSIRGGFNNVQISSLAVADDYIYAGSWSEGVWRRPLYEVMTGVDMVKNNVPGGFRLEQNYPNPFNPTTMISYHLSAVTHVSLTVYDVLGRLVKTLVSRIETPGMHYVAFDAHNLPSGVYFYNLRAGGQSQTRKLLLLK